ncbi:MAG: flagellar assembly protein T N-terminal domain-containing protein [Rhodobacteraceae bacterium]|nr:flagellar assembly protein T N-terminal domain-containing protein [Paracoccaceae bacterium]
MKRFFPFLALALAFGLALPAKAEVRRVQAMGQAVNSGLGADVTRRRALQEALIEAALSAGVDVNGYAASASSVLTADQLVVRPSSRILGYTILSEGKTGDFYRVTVEAYVGDPEPADFCAKRAPVAALAYRPAASADLNSPVWLEKFGADLAEDIQDALLRSENGKMTRTNASGPEAASMSTVPLDMDYTTLTRRRSSAATPGKAAVGLAITSNLSLALLGGDQSGTTVAMSLTLRLVDAASMQVKSQKKIEMRAPVGTVLPIRQLNQMMRKDRQKIAALLMEGIDVEINDFLGHYRCEPLAAPLEYSGGKLSLPFGSEDGLTKNMLAYTDRGDQPFLLFRITDLQPHRVTLATIDPMSDARQLQGVPARFMADTP